LQKHEESKAKKAVIEAMGPQIKLLYLQSVQEIFQDKKELVRASH
jgi:hypothetical protein